jgi:putative phosphoribosyl transferase
MSCDAGPVFVDRTDAGVRLGILLRERDWSDPVVLGLARGGVPVAAAVAAAIGAPLDVAVARKISLPGQPDVGVGAVTANGPARYDETALARYALTPEVLWAGCERARAEARRRLRRYREVADPVPLAGRDVLLVDDGLATGVTARVALEQLRAAGPRRLVFAAPVCARRSRTLLQDEARADEVVCLLTPSPFGAVSLWYDDFAQTSGDEVLDALAGRRA